MKFLEGSSGQSNGGQRYVKINEDFLKVKHLLPTNKVTVLLAWETVMLVLWSCYHLVCVCLVDYIQVLQTILHDNASQARQLDSCWKSLDKRCKKHRVFADRTKRNFLHTQARKQGILLQFEYHQVYPGAAWLLVHMNLSLGITMTDLVMISIIFTIE